MKKLAHLANSLRTSCCFYSFYAAC